MTGYLSVLAGFALLIFGGEVLVRGAVALAERLQVSAVLVGLTVVALGTSAPELSVAINAVLEGVPDLAVGNVVGSNISNILLVLGGAALVRELRAETRMVMRDGLFLVAISTGLAALTLTGSINAVQGGLFVCLLGLYIVYGYWAERLGRSPVAERRIEEVEEFRGVPPQFLFALPLIIAGIGGVVFGAELLVAGAVSLAQAWGVSEAVIGLSVVAIGTSLPELAVSGVAAYRGRGDVAVGNIIGSNIANTLGILGIAAMVSPLTVARQIAAYDIWVMVLATFILIPVLLHGRSINRSEAAVFLLLYGLYITSLFMGGSAYVIDLLGVSA